jgi:CubicO group peptidase (beta-lactamase class C family)
MRALSVFILSILIFSSCSEKPKLPPVKQPTIELNKGRVFATKELENKYYRLDTLFQNLFKANAFNGNVIIAQGGTIVYENSFGIADKSKKTTLQTNSVFQLASVSKTLTATLVLILADEGKLKLSEDVSKYLPGFPYKGVTVEHLISHRSGLSNYLYFCGELGKAKNGKLCNGDVLDFIISTQPQPYLKPGVRFNYCNTNYMLLASIAEKVSGKKYKDLLREKILNPLAMKHTYFEDEFDSLPDSLKTTGYTFSMQEVAKDCFDFVYGDKGIYSTTHDLFTFNEALFTGKLLKPATLENALKPYSSERKQTNYGYGWRMKFFDSPEKIVFHNGWWHGYRTALQRRLSDSTTVVILSNRLNRSVYNVSRVLQVLDGKMPGNIQPNEDESEE